jgi:dolichol kinase
MSVYVNLLHVMSGIFRLVQIRSYKFRLDLVISC